MSAPQSSTTAQDRVARIRSVAAEIKADMESDVRRLDGQHLTGRLVAEVHGTLAAAISALAGMVDALAEHIDQAIDTAVHDHAENAPHLYADGSS